MSKGFSEHVIAVVEGNAPCDDWHDADAASLLEGIRCLRDGLGDELTRDVRPEDLSIGGLAVSRVLCSSRYERGRTLDIGELEHGPSEGTARLEYWATDGESVVMVAK